jgi:hypothetical protein
MNMEGVLEAILSAAEVGDLSLALSLDKERG